MTTVFRLGGDVVRPEAVQNFLGLMAEGTGDGDALGSGRIWHPVRHASGDGRRADGHWEPPQRFPRYNVHGPIRYRADLLPEWGLADDQGKRMARSDGGPRGPHGVDAGCGGPGASPLPG